MLRRRTLLLLSIVISVLLHATLIGLAPRVPMLRVAAPAPGIAERFRVRVTEDLPPVTVEPEPDPEPEQPKNSGGTILLVLAVAVIGGVAGWYFKIYRPQKQQAADAAEDYGDDYDDTPPWEDENETESEGEE